MDEFPEISSAVEPVCKSYSGTIGLSLLDVSRPFDNLLLFRMFSRIENIFHICGTHQREFDFCNNFDTMVSKINVGSTFVRHLDASVHFGVSWK